MKNILSSFAASVAVFSLSTSVFACPRLDSADNSASTNQPVIVLAQASGGAAAGNSGGSGKNNTIDEQTGKTTSDAPGSMTPDDVQKPGPDTTGSVAPSVPDNRSQPGTNKGEENPANPVVK